MPLRAVGARRRTARADQRRGDSRPSWRWPAQDSFWPGDPPGRGKPRAREAAPPARGAPDRVLAGRAAGIFVRRQPAPSPTRGDRPAPAGGRDACGNRGRSGSGRRSPRGDNRRRSPRPGVDDLPNRETHVRSAAATRPAGRRACRSVRTRETSSTPSAISPARIMPCLQTGQGGGIRRRASPRCPPRARALRLRCSRGKHAYRQRYDNLPACATRRNRL